MIFLSLVIQSAYISFGIAHSENGQFTSSLPRSLFTAAVASRDRATSPAQSLKFWGATSAQDVAWAAFCDRGSASGTNPR
jgi:hypothetical protein